MGVLSAAWRATSRSLLNPVSRTAIMTFVWAHRHEVLRWGRSLWDQLARPDVDAGRAIRTAKVLYVIAADGRFRDAKELRKVSMDGRVVLLDVDQGWRLLPELVERLRAVPDVSAVRVRGGIVDATSRETRSRHDGPAAGTRLPAG